MTELEDKKVFKPGDFITYSNRKGSFAIYEGNLDMTKTYLKDRSLIAWYDPNTYQKTHEGHWDYVLNLSLATRSQKCTKCVDTDKEDYWWHICTKEEKEKALTILQDYGYAWDEDSKAIIDITTGEIVKTIATPKNEYHGEIIKPITNALKRTLKKFCLSKNKPITPASTYPSYQGQYRGYNYDYDYENEYWD